MAEHFVLDGVAHPYNMSAANQRGRYGQIFADVMYSFHPAGSPPETALSRDEWMHDWQVEEFVETMFLESATDMVCTHSLPIYDAFHDGGCGIERGAQLKAAYPDRILWYACANLWDGPAALDALRVQITEQGADGIKLYPAYFTEDGTRYFKMDNEEVVYPVLDLARELGVRNIAVHKALPSVRSRQRPSVFRT